MTKTQTKRHTGRFDSNAHPAPGPSRGPKRNAEPQQQQHRTMGWDHVSEFRLLFSRVSFSRVFLDRRGSAFYSCMSKPLFRIGPYHFAHIMRTYTCLFHRLYIYMSISDMCKNSLTSTPKKAKTLFKPYSNMLDPPLVAMTIQPPKGAAPWCWAALVPPPPLEASGHSRIAPPWCGRHGTAGSDGRVDVGMGNPS